MSDAKRTDPFPIRGTRLSNGVVIPPSKVAWWFAEIAYVRFIEVHGRFLSMEQIAERGGFEPGAFLDYLCGGDGSGKTFRARVAHRQRSIKNELEIIVPGTKEYRDFSKWLAEQRKKELAAKQPFGKRMVFGSTGRK